MFTCRKLDCLICLSRHANDYSFRPLERSNWLKRLMTVADEGQFKAKATNAVRERSWLIPAVHNGDGGESVQRVG